MKHLKFIVNLSILLVFLLKADLFAEKAPMNQGSQCTDSLSITTNISGGNRNYVADNSITATNMISESATVHYGAKTRVVLKTGFRVYPGSSFKADLNGCTALNFKNTEPDIQSKNLNCTPESIIKYYPNPLKGILTLEISGVEGNKSVSILNMSGSVIFQTESSENILNLDIGSQQKGIYFIKINYTEGSFMDKLIIE